MAKRAPLPQPRLSICPQSMVDWMHTGFRMDRGDGSEAIQYIGTDEAVLGPVDCLFPQLSSADTCYDVPGGAFDGLLREKGGSLFTLCDTNKTTCLPRPEYLTHCSWSFRMTQRGQRSSAISTLSNRAGVRRASPSPACTKIPK